MWARCLRVLLDRVLHAQPVSWRVAPHDAPRLFLRASHAKPTARWHQEPRARFGNGLDFIDAALNCPIAVGIWYERKGRDAMVYRVWFARAHRYAPPTKNGGGMICFSVLVGKGIRRTAPTLPTGRSGSSGSRGSSTTTARGPTTAGVPAVRRPAMLTGAGRDR